MKWLIWSHEHQSWWRTNGYGYSVCKSDAGRFSFEEAVKIVQDANTGLTDTPNEAMVPEQDS